LIQDGFHYQRGIIHVIPGPNGTYLLVEGYHRVTALWYVSQAASGVSFANLNVPDNMLRLSQTGYQKLRKLWQDSRKRQFTMPIIPAFVLRADSSQEDVYSWCFCKSLLFWFVCCVALFTTSPHTHTHKHALTHTLPRHQWSQRGCRGEDIQRRPRGSYSNHGVLEEEAAAGRGVLPYHQAVVRRGQVWKPRNSW
jgi:hypothetical protein